jgi:hypothetical protein
LAEEFFGGGRSRRIELGISRGSERKAELEVALCRGFLRGWLVGAEVHCADRRRRRCSAWRHDRRKCNTLC